MWDLHENDGVLSDVEWNPKPMYSSVLKVVGKWIVVCVFCISNPSGKR